jgi:hypothetical protein
VLKPVWADRPRRIGEVPPLGFIRDQAEGLCKEDGMDVKVRALLAERRRKIGYEQELVVAVVGC